MGNLSAQSVGWIIASILVPCSIGAAGIYTSGRGWRVLTSAEVALQEANRSQQLQIDSLRKQVDSLNRQLRQLTKDSETPANAIPAQKSKTRDVGEDKHPKERSQNPEAESAPPDQARAFNYSPTTAQTVGDGSLSDKLCTDESLHLPDSRIFLDANILVLYQEGLEGIADRIAVCLRKLPRVQQVHVEQNRQGFYMMPGIVRYRYRVDEPGARYLGAYLENFGFSQSDLERTTTPSLDYKFEIDVDDTLLLQADR